MVFNESISVKLRKCTSACVIAVPVCFTANVAKGVEHQFIDFICNIHLAYSMFLRKKRINFYRVKSHEIIMVMELLKMKKFF